jgi:hypothetical protein
VRRGVAAASLAALVALGPAEGEGQAARRIAVLGFSGEGLAADVREQFETLIEERLRLAGYGVVSRATTQEELTRRELPERCAFGPCVEPIGIALGVDRFLDARIGADGQSYSFVLSLVEARRGSSIDQVVGTCDVCTVAEALAKVGQGIDTLGGRGLAEGTPRAASRGAGTVTRVAPRRPSKTWPAILVGVGLAMAGGGAALVSQTTHDDAGFVTIGSGGTVALTGLVWLLVGD